MPRIKDTTLCADLDSFLEVQDNNQNCQKIPQRFAALFQSNVNKHLKLSSFFNIVLTTTGELCPQGMLKY